MKPLFQLREPYLSTLLLQRTWQIVFFSILFSIAVSADESLWTHQAPREEIAPLFEKLDGANLKLTAQGKETNGFWRKIYPVSGGQHYKFSTTRLAKNVEFERRSCSVRIDWYGKNGKPVKSPHKFNPAYFGSDTGIARPEFPRDKRTNIDGSVLVEDVYLAPDDAIEARVQLAFRWSENGSVIWKKVTFAVSDPLPSRLVRLAAVHTNLNQEGKNTSEGNLKHLVPLIEKAAEQGADLIVLGEFVTCKNVSSDFPSLAESIPGPTTEFFSSLAKKHDCYLVFSIPERDGKVVYNAAVMVGPDGEIGGKYRKLTLPCGEVERGISPGSDYPVFDTRFGKVGMMICYDVFFPEVARGLAMKGAEIIALPIWGGNPRLAAARCAENGIYLVTSTYTHHDSNWMKSAVWNREGDRIVEAKKWNSVVVTEVDLNEATYWYGLGNFQARIQREAPILTKH